MSNFHSEDFDLESIYREPINKPLIAVKGINLRIDPLRMKIISQNATVHKQLFHLSAPLTADVNQGYLNIELEKSLVPVMV